VSPPRTSEIFSFAPQPGDLEPFELGGGDNGVLLIHGFCGTPPEMRGLGEHLAQHGFLARGMLLPGHGTSPEDLDNYVWRDWVDAAQAELDGLRQRCARVFVAGQSMGGTVTLYLGAHNPDVAAIATTAALVNLGRRSHTMIRFGRYVRRWHYPDRERVDLWDQAAVAQLRSYNKRSVKSHMELLRLMAQVWHDLPLLEMPALIMHGRGDQTVPPRNAGLIAARIGANATLRYFERSGHAMSVDVDREEVFQLIGDRFLAVARPPVGAEARA
jgi:carboxylesterase